MKFFSMIFASLLTAGAWGLTAHGGFTPIGLTLSVYITMVGLYVIAATAGDK